MQPETQGDWRHEFLYGIIVNFLLFPDHEHTRKIILGSQVNRKIGFAVEVRLSLKLRWNMKRILVDVFYLYLHCIGQDLLM